MVTKEETAVIVSPKGNLPQTLSPDSTIHASSTDREGNASILPEKPSEDGYNWRKYGQKNVKGNEFIRSYYKCSHPNCLVKKQVERSHDGRITDITYLGNHEHAKPHSDSRVTVPSLLSVKVQIPECLPSTVAEDKPSDLHSPASDRVQKMDVCEDAIVKTADHTPPAAMTPLSQARDDVNENFTLKRRKKSIDGPDSATDKPNHESRVVVHTVSEVDIVNDGYRWRKYGQKMVKGNPNPRSYYRCSTTGCPVKKHVERASHDPKVVITTYEGQHDHSVPPVRTIVPQAVAAYAGGTETNGLSNSKLEERDAAQDSAIVLFKPEKDDSVDPTTKEEKNIAIVAKTEDVITESTAQEANHTAERIEHIPQTTMEIDMGIQAKSKLEMTSEQQNPSSEKISQTTVKVETGIQAKAKLEVTSQEQNPGSENISQTNTDVDTRIQADTKLEMTSKEQNLGSENISQSTMEVDTGIQAETKLEITSQEQNPGSGEIDQTAKQESVASPQVDPKPEVVSTDIKRDEAIVESSHAEVKPNGVQMPNAEAVNC